MTWSSSSPTTTATTRHSTGLPIWRRRDPRVKVLRFKRNYGFQRSLLTAYKHASGDAAIQIDCDLQDPPELLPRFVALWENGHDVVVGLRRRRQESRLLTLGRRSFYKILNNISDERITPNAGDFRLVDRSVLDRLDALDDQNPYVRGIISSLAANETGIPYDRIERRHGKSKFPVRKLFGFALNGIFGHSIVPLRIATYVGLLASSITFLLSLSYLVARVLPWIGMAERLRDDDGADPVRHQSQRDLPGHHRRIYQPDLPAGPPPSAGRRRKEPEHAGRGSATMKAVILAGGRGTRIAEESSVGRSR